jgi:hypothetical protein
MASRLWRGSPSADTRFSANKLTGSRAATSIVAKKRERCVIGSPKVCVGEKNYRVQVNIILI